jgi:ketosteroid isomerase-like protein
MIERAAALGLVLAASIASSSAAWPDGAVLAGVADANETTGGAPNAIHARFTDVWAKRGGRWRVVFTHFEKLP